MEKELLRRATVGVLPDAIRTRPKTALAEDPVTIFAKDGQWRPSLQKPHDALPAFVDLKRLASAWDNPERSSLWVDLRPISLHYWLASH
jgi:hypothetical protein